MIWDDGWEGHRQDGAPFKHEQVTSVIRHDGWNSLEAIARFSRSFMRFEGHEACFSLLAHTNTIIIYIIACAHGSSCRDFEKKVSITTRQSRMFARLQMQCSIARLLSKIQPLGVVLSRRKSFHCFVLVKPSHISIMITVNENAAAQGISRRGTGCTHAHWRLPQGTMLPMEHARNRQWGGRSEGDRMWNVEANTSITLLYWVFGGCGDGWIT